MKHNDIELRRADAQDHDEWLRLRIALWPRQTPAELAAELDEIAADPMQPVFVAALPDGRLCGFLEVAVHSEAPGCTSDRIGYLEGWYVDPALRGRGIGAGLVALGEAWAREQGCTEMASDTDGDYPVSPQAHAALGYGEVHREIFFRKPLEDEERPRRRTAQA